MTMSKIQVACASAAVSMVFQGCSCGGGADKPAEEAAVKALEKKFTDAKISPNAGVQKPNVEKDKNTAWFVSELSTKLDAVISACPEKLEAGEKTVACMSAALPYTELNGKSALDVIAYAVTKADSAEKKKEAAGDAEAQKKLCANSVEQEIANGEAKIKIPAMESVKLVCKDKDSIKA